VPSPIRARTAAPERAEALAEAAALGQPRQVAERGIARSAPVVGAGQSEFLRRLLDAANDVQAEAIREAALTAGMLWRCAYGWYNPEDAPRCEAGDPCRAPRPRPDAA
jgi:hypothetical protein